MTKPLSAYLSQRDIHTLISFCAVSDSIQQRTVQAYYMMEVEKESMRTAKYVQLRNKTLRRKLKKALGDLIDEAQQKKTPGSSFPWNTL